MYMFSYDRRVPCLGLDCRQKESRHRTWYQITMFWAFSGSLYLPSRKAYSWKRWAFSRWNNLATSSFFLRFHEDVFPEFCWLWRRLSLTKGNTSPNFSTNNIHSISVGEMQPCVNLRGPTFAYTILRCVSRVGAEVKLPAFWCHLRA